MTIIDYSVGFSNPLFWRTYVTKISITFSLRKNYCLGSSISSLSNRPLLCINISSVFLRLKFFNIIFTNHFYCSYVLDSFPFDWNDRFESTLYNCDRCYLSYISTPNSNDHNFYQRFSAYAELGKKKKGILMYTLQNECLTMNVFHTFRIIFPNFYFILMYDHVVGWKHNTLRRQLKETRFEFVIKSEN